MKMNKSDYLLLIIFSLLSGISMLFFDSIASLQYLSTYTPGLLYGIGLFFFFVRKKRHSPKHVAKGIALILFSFFGYIFAEKISLDGRVFFLFLAPLFGSLVGSLILAYGICKFWSLDKKNIRRLTIKGGILGFILCMPASLSVIKKLDVVYPSEFFYLMMGSVIIWHVVMSVEIIKTIAKNESGEVENLSSQPSFIAPSKIY